MAVKKGLGKGLDSLIADKVSTKVETKKENDKKTESAQPHYMTDIAATVCAMLHIQAPNGCIGTPIF